ncbi:Cytochrome b-c1 complex subunit 8 [Hypsizygus marmoreus]|uniref:Cytochrome b-c1 complex subunit 8 n=1 Tax=Hypsizygus marmoreus TaxID=39966 RepID=A0A369JNE5_HYPMA|nr:Cytochrome b-c1 complex subunit 8 [Hypsizygus marmoreus]
MRPSIARFSDMPGGKVYSLWWGDSGGIRQKGIVQYTLSPFQSKAAPHMIRSYLFNGYRRLSGELLFFLIPFGTGYGIYSWAKSYDAYQNSKAGHIAAGAEHGH